MLPPLFFSVRLPTLLAIFWRVHLNRENISGPRSSGARPILDWRHPGVKRPLSFILFRLDALGDVVLTTPLFRELKRAYPGSRLAVVLQEPYKALLVTNPHVDEVLTLPDVGATWMPQGARRLLSAAYFYWKHLRKRHFDIAMSPRWDVDEHLATLLCLLANADGRVGYGEEASASKQAINRGFSAAFSHCIPAGGIRHEVWRNLAIVEAIAGPVASSSLEIHLTERDRRHAGRILQDAPNCSKWIAMGIGARSPGRRWPVERYAEVVTQLAKVDAVHAIILCSAAEHADARALASLLGRNHTIVSGGQLREVGAVLERCDLFLGNDSGCAHLAAAMNCPAIVISRHPGDGDPNHFNSPVRFAPHGSRVKVLQPVTGLAPCTTACRSLKPHCITTVSVDAVVAASLQMLRETQLQSPPSLPSLSSEYAARHLLDVHSPAAVRRAVEALLVDREHVEMPS